METVVDVGKIRRALDAAGYLDDAAVEENLVECYLDYVDGYGGDFEEAREQIENGEITLDQMCKALIRG